MIATDKITEIYCIVDEYTKYFYTCLNDKLLVESQETRIRQKPCKLSDSEVTTILVSFHLSGTRNLKHFYLYYVQKHLLKEFPKTVSYNRFVELTQKAIIPMIFFLKGLCSGKCTGLSFIDSTPVRVCNNRRIHNHKVFRYIAERGHCSIGYFSS